MKILVDMNLSPGWVEFLVDEGFDAVHWSSVGAGSALDGELMDWAREHGFTLADGRLGFRSHSGSFAASASQWRIKRMALLI
jgi:predicted nuclease of predicted toxin-antitoxin system